MRRHTGTHAATRAPRNAGAWLFAAIVAAVGLVPMQSARAESLRCGGSLVQPGDPAIVVRNACGEPNFVDPWIAGAGLAYGQAPSMEEWTYNRGPGRLLQILIFRDGKLYRIEDGGYGFVEGRNASGCRPSAITRGMSKYRLLQACGAPAQQTGQFVYSARGQTSQGDYYLRQGVVPVYRERWIYNFGGNRLLRQITLENAIVVETDTLRRGFDH